MQVQHAGQSRSWAATSGTADVPRCIGHTQDTRLCTTILARRGGGGAGSRRLRATAPRGDRKQTSCVALAQIQSKGEGLYELSHDRLEQIRQQKKKNAKKRQQKRRKTIRQGLDFRSVSFYRIPPSTGKGVRNQQPRARREHGGVVSVFVTSRDTLLDVAESARARAPPGRTCRTDSPNAARARGIATTTGVISSISAKRPQSCGAGAVLPSNHILFILPSLC
jgi:hypothetical protein